MRTPCSLESLILGHPGGWLAWGAEVTFSTVSASPRAASFRDFRLGDGRREALAGLGLRVQRLRL